LQLLDRGERATVSAPNESKRKMPHPDADPKEAPILAAAAMPSSPQSSRRRSATLKPVRYRDDDDAEKEKEEKKLVKVGQKIVPTSSSNIGERKHPPTPSQADGNNNNCGGGSSDEDKPTKKRPRSSNPWEKLNQVPNVATTTPAPCPSTKARRSPQDPDPKHLRKKKSISSSSSPISPKKKQIEMQYLHKGRKVKVRLFDSFPKASDKTGISVPLMKIVCEEGGGFINAAWFEYSQSSRHNNATTKTNLTSLATMKGTNIAKTKKKNILPKTNDFFTGGGRPFDVTSLRPLDPDTCSGVGGLSITSLAGSAVAAGRITCQKRVIELVCKTTGKPLVCFPEIQHAAVALGITPEQAARACNSYGAAEQYDFLKYFLRFKVDSKVYLYGSNQGDFQIANPGPRRHRRRETHNERMARWSTLMPDAALTVAGSKSVPGHSAAIAPDVDPPTVSVPRQIEMEKIITYHEVIPNAQLLEETLNLFENTTVLAPTITAMYDAGDSTRSLVAAAPTAILSPVVLIEHPPNATVDSSLCIFCQEQNAGIIFEPCGHCVICEGCASWACRHFCPRCRTLISTRRRSTSLFRGVKLDLALKPKTFSAYSFMDF
jgi:hypothetical protein